MKKILIGVAALALGALGAWLLYDRYGKRVERLEGPAHQFADRAVSAVEDAGRTIGRAGNQATDAVETAAGRIADAAKLAGRDAASEFSE
jgi:hypothetical protein